MKTKLVLFLLASCRLSFAAVSVAGPMTYTQNFNTLPVANSAWTDNVTLPNWYLFRDGATITNPAPLNVSNGSGAWVANLYSLGVTGNTDRALGASPTTNHGAYSFIVLFQNTSAAPVKVSRVKYNVETYRANSTANTQTETLAFSRRIANTQAEITSALNSGWTNDATMDYLLPGQPTGSAVLPPLVATINKAPAGDITVLPNQVLGLRWTNVNDGGEDAYMGIDDVEVQFVTPGCAISGAASNIVRNNNGTPANLNDDTIGFNLLVTGFGTGNSGWKSISGPVATGSYSVAKQITGVPVASFPLSMTLADVEMTTCTTTVTITSPISDLAVTPTNSPTITFNAPPLAAQSYVRTSTGTEPGWTGGSAAAKVAAQPAPNTTARYFDINLARPTFTTEAVNISAVTDFRVSIDLSAYTTSTTAFEDPDTFAVIVQTSPVATGGTWTTVATLLDTSTTGSALFDAIGAGINFVGNFPATDFPFVTYRSASLARGTANYARLVASGGNDSASEHTLLDNIKFSAVAPSVSAPYTTTRNNMSDDDPSNDVFYVNAKVSAELVGGNPIWTSNTTPATGFYDPANAVVFGPYPVSAGPVTITITDSTVPAATVTLVVPPPPTSLKTDIINVLRDEKGTVTLNDDSISLDLTMLGTNASTGWTSNIPIPGAPGTFYSGNYEVLYHIVADVSTLPTVPLIMDKADPTAQVALGASLPSPSVYVIGDLVTLSAAPALVPSAPGISPNNVWRNLTNGVLTLNDGSSAIDDLGFLDTSLITIDSDLIMLDNVGQVNVTAELTVTETSASSNFEADDTFKVRIWWYADGQQFEKNLIDPFDSDGNEVLNGYNDTAARPYNSNKLLDEFNRPSPGLALAGSINNTFQLSGTIPANAEYAGMIIEGLNNSADERYVLKNVHFIEAGANPTADGDGDGVSNADEDIMGTDKFDASSVLRLVQTPGNPSQFSFSGIPGRFYRVYRSDDAADVTHLTKWVDAGLPTLQDFGPHTVNVTVDPNEPRRFYRVHVKQTDGPWEATVS